MRVKAVFLAKINPTKSVIALLLVSFYLLLFYGIFTHQVDVDFPSFYSTALSLRLGENPYRELFTTYLPTVKQVALNLNPPIFLCLLIPLSSLSYSTALIIWCAVSFLLGLIGAGIAFSYAFSADFFKKHWFYLYSAYLASFGVIISTTFAQLGSLLLFFTMAGYYCYLKKRDVCASLCWGLIISIKFFPGLLLIYALIQQRYRLSALMLLVVLLLCCLPLVAYGPSLYQQYFSMMSNVHWYGWNCNASLFGYFMRLSMDNSHIRPPYLWMYLLYAMLSITILIFYWLSVVRLAKRANGHQAFSLTLVMMLLLSPLGWVYYFPILVLPVSLLALSPVLAQQRLLYNQLLSFLSVVLLNVPMIFTSRIIEGSLFDKLTVYSLHCYGLLLLVPQMQTEHRLGYDVCFALVYRYICALVMLVVSILLLKRLVGS